MTLCTTQSHYVLLASSIVATLFLSSLPKTVRSEGLRHQRHRQNSETLTCGQHISSDTTLMHDLTCQCPYGYALYVRNSATLDLDGNEVKCEETGGGVVLLMEGGSIKNGVLTGGYYGVDPYDSGSTIEYLEINNPRYAGIAAAGSHNVTIRNNDISGARYGIKSWAYEPSSTGLSIINNRIVDNYFGIHFEDAESSMIRDNSFDNSNSDIELVNSTDIFIGEENILEHEVVADDLSTYFFLPAPTQAPTTFTTTLSTTINSTTTSTSPPSSLPPAGTTSALPPSSDPPSECCTWAEPHTSCGDPNSAWCHVSATNCATCSGYWIP